jgi:hypothetical protein
MRICAMGCRKTRRTDLLGIKTILAGGLLATFVAASAQAAPTRQAEERAARKACLSGDFMKGVSILSDLFVDTKDVTYLFNQGRCFEQNLRYQEAIGRFQEYLRVGTNLDASDKAAAEKHVADCQALLAKQTGPTAVSAASPPMAVQVGSAVPPAPAPSPVPDSILVQQPKHAPSKSGAGMRTAGLVGAAVGGMVVVGGIILNLKVNSMASDMESTPGGYSPSKESDRKTFETLSLVSYSLAARGESLRIAVRADSGPSAASPLA